MMMKSSYLRSIFTFMNVELSYLRVSPNILVDVKDDVFP